MELNIEAADHLIKIHHNFHIPLFNNEVHSKQNLLFRKTTSLFFFSYLDNVFFNFIIFSQVDLLYILLIVQNTKLSFHSHGRGCCCVPKVFMNVENDTVDVFQFVLTGRARCEYMGFGISYRPLNGDHTTKIIHFIYYTTPMNDKTHSHTSLQIYIISSDYLKTPLFVFLT